MKIQARQIDSFIKNPPPQIRVILIYGPDAGLMKERSETIARTVVEDLNDPFNVAVLSTDSLAEDPARLADEAAAISMIGGKRLVRVEGAGDKIKSLVEDYLSAPNENALIILEAGELGPRSSLRKLCEQAELAAALPCYVEDERDLSRFIRETLQAENLQAAPDAVAWLAVNIAGDRMKARRELEKLILYKGPEKTPLTLDEAQQACGETGAQTLDDFVYSVAGRNAEQAMQIYQRLLEEGVPFIVIIRALQNHFRRLHLSRARMDKGASADAAMKSLVPRIFFKQEAAFRAQIQSWPLKKIDLVTNRLMDLESQCKQTGAAVESLCAQAYLSISAMRAG